MGETRCRKESRAWKVGPSRPVWPRAGAWLPRHPVPRSGTQRRACAGRRVTGGGPQRATPRTRLLTQTPFRPQEQQRPLASLRLPPSAVDIGRQLGGSKGGGAAVLERSGLDLSQASQEFSAKTDDTGGDGGNGGSIKNGGGGGDGDEGDDDEYRDDGDEEVRPPPLAGQRDGGAPPSLARLAPPLTPLAACAQPTQGGDDGFLSVRTALPEQFDRATLACVLAEWYRTIADLPAGLRLAVELGLVSSLQLVRFLAVDCRPTLVRAAHRVLPTGAARAFVGRLMADPSFLAKLAVEQAITVAAGTAYEAAARGPRLRDEAGHATVGVAGQLASNAAAVWLLAPSRSYGAPTSSATQRLLQSLPNHVFDACGPLRQYTVATRAAGALLKASQLAGLGALIGGSTTQLQAALVRRRQEADPTWRPAVHVPDLRTGALGTAAWLGLSCTARYNLLAGADRWMHERLSSLTAAVAGTCALRLVNNHIGDASRLWLLGLPSSDALAQWGGRITGLATVAATQGGQQRAWGAARRRSSAGGQSASRRRSSSSGAGARARSPPAGPGGEPRSFSVTAVATAAPPAGRRQ